MVAVDARLRWMLASRLDSCVSARESHRDPEGAFRRKRGLQGFAADAAPTSTV